MIFGGLLRVLLPGTPIAMAGLGCCVVGCRGPRGAAAVAVPLDSASKRERSEATPPGLVAEAESSPAIALMLEWLLRRGRRRGEAVVGRQASRDRGSRVVVVGCSVPFRHAECSSSILPSNHDHRFNRGSDRRSWLASSPQASPALLTLAEQAVMRGRLGGSEARCMRSLSSVSIIDATGCPV